MNGGALFFVYGLLMTGYPGFSKLELSTRSRVVGPARVRGRLYDLGDYPGLLTSDDGVVLGELISVLDPRLIDELDTYEMYDPGNAAESEYLRRPVLALDRSVEAWTYVYNRPVTGFPIIESGDWRRR
jgi:gamma-glutamylcyclotransferase (GGCT)/AIG2-like uncharacterized protein YtfP